MVQKRTVRWPASVELQQELYIYLLKELNDAHPRERHGCGWVMNREWWDEVRKLSGHQAPVTVEGSTYLLGLPTEIRDDGGVPHLEPRQS